MIPVIAFFSPSVDAVNRTGASTKDQELQPSKQPDAQSPRIAQIHAELLRLGQKAVEIANAGRGKNVDAIKTLGKLKAR